MQSLTKQLQCMLLGAVVCFSFPAFANKAVILGPVYPIAEQDFLSYIQQRLKQLDLKAYQSRIKQKALRRIQKQIPVSGLTRTTKARTFIYNPSITVPYDLTDNQGRVFAKAGTTVNPLRQVSLSKPLLFFNANDKDQLKWALRQDKKLHGKDKLILTGGSFVELAKKLHHPVYYDQAGKITAKIGITHVPAIVKQKGLMLEVQEQIP